MKLSVVVAVVAALCVQSFAPADAESVTLNANVVPSWSDVVSSSKTKKIRLRRVKNYVAKRESKDKDAAAAVYKKYKDKLAARKAVDDRYNAIYDCLGKYKMTTKVTRSEFDATMQEFARCVSGDPPVQLQDTDDSLPTDYYNPVPVDNDGDEEDGDDDVAPSPTMAPAPVVEPSPYVPQPEPVVEPSPYVPEPQPQPEPVVEPSPYVPEPVVEPSPYVPEPVVEPSPYVPEPQPQPEPVVEPSPYVPEPVVEPSPYVPEPQPQPEPVVEPSPYVPEPVVEPSPYVPEPVVEPSPYVPEPVVEPSPYVPEPVVEPSPYVPEPQPQPPVVDPGVPNPLTESPSDFKPNVVAPPPDSYPFSPASRIVPPLWALDMDGSDSVNEAEWTTYLSRLYQIASDRANAGADQAAVQLLISQIQFHYTALNKCISEHITSVRIFSIAHFD
ncbi:hypothetical protein PINS_up005559 [Pythium insidiosum]|nr:hypothetical protein PINS_up005559 [Pythium insidiosum]